MKTMTEGGLVKSNLVKAGKHLVIPLDALKGFEFDHYLLLYVKTKREFKIVGINNAAGNYFIDVTVYAEPDRNPAPLMLKVNAMMMNNIEKQFGPDERVMWTSGICDPSNEMKEMLGLKDNACVWEAILKIPAGHDIEKVISDIRESDTGGDIKHLDIKEIEIIDRDG